MGLNCIVLGFNLVAFLYEFIFSNAGAACQYTVDLPCYSPVAYCRAVILVSTFRASKYNLLKTVDNSDYNPQPSDYIAQERKFFLRSNPTNARCNSCGAYSNYNQSAILC